MNNTLFMRSFERLCDLLGYGEGFINGDRSLSNPISEGRSFDQLQHQRTGIVCFFDPVDSRNTGLVEARENLGFSLEPCKPIRISGKRFRQDLESHLPVQRGIGRLPHFTHPTFTDLGGDCVVAESCADAERH